MHTALRGAFGLYAGLIFGVVIVATPLTTYAADILFSPTSVTFPTGQEFSIKVTLDPSGESVNAADGTVTFDKDVLTVVNVSKEGSAFSLWTADPTYSNSAGTVSFSGGTPSSFSKTSTILTITFKGKKSGSAKASITKGSVLAADGKGTDVYKTGGEEAFTITDAAPTPADVPVDDGGDGAAGPVPLAPDITSSTHAKPDLWYATSTAIFTWKNQPDVLSVRTLLSDKADAVPSELLKGTPMTQIVTGIKDGVSYFYVQFKNDSGWGGIGQKKIQIDTVPPKEFDVALIAATKDTPAKFSMGAEDELSGIDHYDIIMGGSVVASPKALELTNNTFPVPPQDGGPQKVTIKAYDKAGNAREVSKDFTLPKVAKPVAAGSGDAPPVQTGSLWERILLVIFALVIGALATMIYNARKVAAAEKSKILKRVNEAADKNDRVFSAMREEFEQMINDLDEKPQLTEKERDFLENVKEVLDISEELIDTGVEELKKAIRGV